MKQIYSRVLLLIILIAAILGLSSCNFIFSQEIANYELKVDYFEREVVYNSTVDVSGLGIEVTTGSSVKTISVTRDMIAAKSDDTSSIGEKTLIIEYKGERWTLVYEVLYQVEYVSDGKTYDVQLVRDIKELDPVSDPEKDGSTFLGWSQRLPDKLTGNLRLEAVFSDSVTAPKFTAKYGDTLGSLTLPSSTIGTWAWGEGLTADTEVGAVGTNSFEVIFTPHNPDLETVTLTAKVAVSKRVITFKVNDSFEYDGTSHKLSYELYDGDQKLPDELSNKIKANIICFGTENATDVGSYFYKLRIYDDSYDGVISGELEISKKKITVEVLIDGKDSCEFTYGNNPASDKYSYRLLDKSGNVISGFLHSSIQVTIVKPTTFTAGTHTISARVEDTDDDGINDLDSYEITVKDASVKVKQADYDPGVPVITTDKIYYGDKLSSVTFKEHPNGKWSWKALSDDENITVGNAGTKTFTAVFTPKDQSYKSIELDWSLKVQRKELTFSFDNKTATYDGKEHSLTYEIIGLVGTDKVTVIATYGETTAEGNLKFTNAGSYSIEFSVNDSNYSAKFTERLVINKATVAKPQVTGGVYDGTSLYGTYEKSELYEEKSRTDNVNVKGDHYVIFKLKDPDNYEWEDETFNGKVTYEITQAENSWTTSPKIEGWTYTTDSTKKNAPEAKARFGNSVTFKYKAYGKSDSAYTLDRPTNAGKYTLQATVSGNDNYTSISCEVNFEIAKATATINVPEATNGFNYTFTYNGDKHELTGFSASSAQTVDYIFEEVNAGEYTVILTALENANYKEVSKTVKVKINKAEATISGVENKSYTYSPDGYSIPTATVTLNDGTTKSNIVGVPDRTIENVGTYTVTYTYSDDNHIEVSKEVTVTVNKAQVEKPTAVAKTYTYNGSDQTFKLDGVNDLMSVSGDKRTDAGSQKVTVSLKDKANYEWKNTSSSNDITFDFEIAKLSIENAKVTLGSALTYNGIEQTQNIESVKIGELDVDFDVSNNKATLAGTSYQLTISGTGNFAGTKTVTFAVAKAQVEKPTAVAKTYTYNGSDQTFKLDGVNDLMSVSGDKRTDAGSQKVTVSLKDKANYEWKDASGNNTNDIKIIFTIETKKIDVPKPEKTAFEYDGTQITFFTVKNTDPYYIDGIGTNSGIGYGEYKVKLILRDTLNTEWNDETSGSGSRTLTFNITKAENVWTSNLTITGWTYGDTANVPSATPKFGKDTVDYQYKLKDADDSTYSTTVPTKAGSYTVRATVAGNANYEGITATADFTIAKATNVINGTLNIDGWTYGQPKNSPEGITGATFGTVKYEYSSDNGANWTEWNLNDSTTAPENAGKYQVRAYVAASVNEDNSVNYDRVATESVPFNINVRKVTAPTFDGTSFIYNTTTQKPKVTDNDDTKYYSYTYTKEESINVGEYTITVTLNSDYGSNIAWSDGAVTEFTYKITKKPVTVPEVKGGTYDGTNVYGTFEPSDLYTGTVTGTKDVAGDHYVTFTLKDPSNYKWEDEYDTDNDGTIRVDYTIDKANATINGVNSDKKYTLTYGNKEFTTLEGITASHNESNISYTITDKNGKPATLKNAGTYTVVISLEESTNYNAATSIEVEVEIAKATETVTISAKDNVTNYDHNTSTLKLVYNNETFSVDNYLTAALSGETSSGRNYKEVLIEKINTSGISLFTTASNNELYGAGTYKVTYVYEANTNFNESTKTVYVEIAKAQITLSDLKPNYPSTDKKSWTYGDTISYTVKSSHDFVTVKYYYGTSLTGTFTETAPKDAKTYYVYAIVEGNDNWYAAQTAPESFTINSKKAEISANQTINVAYKNAEWTLDELKSYINASITDVLDKDNSTLTYTVKDSRTIKDADTYTVTVSYENSNYTVTSVDVKVEVTKASATIDITNTVEGGDYKTDGYDLSSITAKATDANGNIVTGLETYRNDKKVDALGIVYNVGTYTVTFKLNNSNYTATEQTVEVTITKAPVTLPQLEWTKNVYNGNVQKPKVTSTDDSRYSVSYSNEDSTTVGEYFVTFTLTDEAAKNYKWSIPENSGVIKVDDTTIKVPYKITEATTNKVTLTPNYSTTDKESWTYGDTVRYTASASLGTPTLTYSKLQSDGKTYKKIELGDGKLGAGSYKVEATVEATKNYNGDTATEYFTVAQVTNKDKVTTAQNATYGDKLSSVALPTSTIGTWSWEALSDNEDVTVGNVGENTFIAIFIPSDTTNYASREVEVKVTVAPKPIDVPKLKDGQTFTYKFGEEDKNITPELVLPILADGDEASSVYTITGLENSTAGTYKVTVTLNSSNYKWNDDKEEKVREFTYKISKYEIEVPIINDLTYNGTHQCPTIPTGNYSVTENNGGTDHGDNYKVILELSDKDNTKWKSSTSDRVTINEKAGTVTINYSIKGVENTWTDGPTITKEQIYGNVSGGTATAQYGDVKIEYKSNDTSVTEWSETCPEDVGKYLVRFTTLDASATTLQETFEFEIKPATANITVNGSDQNVTYTTDGYNLSSITASATDTNGDTVTGLETYLNGNIDTLGKVYDVGTYTVTFKLNNSNYTATEQSVTITITKSTVTLPKLEWIEKEYNGNVQKPETSTDSRYSVSYSDEDSITVDKYSVTFTLKDPDKYKWADGEETASRTLDYKITKASATINGVNSDKKYTLTYGNKEFTTLEGITASHNESNISYTITDKNGEPATLKNAGTYTVVISLAESTNYNAAESVEVTVVINRATATLSGVPSSNETVYTGSAYNLGTVTVKLVDGSETVTPVITLNGTVVDSITNVGTYIVTYSYSDDNHDQVSSGEITIKVNPAKVDLGIIDETVTTDYATGYKPSAVTVTLADGKTTATVYPTIALNGENADSITNVGTYTVTYKFEKENYETATVNITVIIEPTKLEKPTQGTASFTYNGDSKDFIINGFDYRTMAYEYSAGTMTLDSTAHTLKTSATNAGEYTVTVSLNLKDKVNYEWIDEAGNNTNDLTFKFVIEKQSVTPPTISDLTYTGKEQEPDISNQPLYNVETNNGGTNVGEYDVTLTLTDVAKTNYKWPDKYDTDNDGTITISYEIKQATNEWKISLSITGWTYGGTANLPSATPKFGKDTVKYEYSSDNGATWTVWNLNDSTTAPKNAGTYTVRAIVAGNANYTALEGDNANTATFTIATAANVINGTLAIDGWTYGQYDASKNAPTGITGANFGKVEYEYRYLSDNGTTWTEWTEWKLNDSTTAPKNAGKYQVRAYVAASVNEDNSVNYDRVETKAVEFTIEKATYDMTGVKWNYNSSEPFTYNGVAKTVEITGTLPDGVGVASYTNNSATGAGEYTAHVTFTYDTTNYTEPKIDDCTWTINKAQLTKPTQGTASFDYDGTSKEFIINGFDSTTMSYYSSELTFTDGKYSATNAGTYTVKVILNDKDNYEWIDEAGNNTNDLTFTFVINKAQNSGTLEANYPEGKDSWTYGDTVSYTVSDVKGSAKFTIYYSSDGGATWTTTAPTDAKEGYKVKAILAKTDNYAETEIAPETFDINKAQNTITITPNYTDGKTSWTPDDKIEFTTSGVKESANVTLTYCYKDDKGEYKSFNLSADGKLNPGSYKVIATAEATDNYEKTTAELDFEVSLSMVEIEVSDSIENNALTVDYTGAKLSDLIGAYYLVGGTQNSEGITYYLNGSESSTSADNVLDAGTYTVVIKLVGQSYTADEVTVTLTINKATNEWTTKLEENKTWTYGDTVSYTASAAFGTPTLTYYKLKSDGKTYEKIELGDGKLGAGDYKVVATVTGNANYTALEGENANTATFTIKKAKVTKPTQGTASFDYDGTSKEFIINGFDSKTMAYGYSAGAMTLEGTKLKASATNAGTYTVKVILNDKDNYEWIDEKGNNTNDLTFKFVINPYEATLQNLPSSNETEYTGSAYDLGAVTVKLADGSEEKVTPVITLKGTNGSKDTPVTEIIGVGTYTVTYTFEKANYVTVTEPITITINKATNKWEQQLTPNYPDGKTSWTYGYTVSYTAKAAFGTVKYEYSTDNGTTWTEWKLNDSDTEPKSAGTYTVRATVEGNDNYTALEGENANNTATFTIAKAQATLSGVPTDTVSVTYTDGAYSAFPTVTVTTKDTTPTGTITRTITLNGEGVDSITNVGTYTVTYSYEDANNVAESKSYTVTITPKPVVKPTVSGTYVYNGTDQDLALKDFDRDIMSRSGATTGKNAGDYKVTVSLTNSNYCWDDSSTDSITVTFTISQATPTISEIKGTFYENMISYANGALTDGKTTATITFTGVTVNGVTETVSGTFTYNGISEYVDNSDIRDEITAKISYEFKSDNPNYKDIDSYSVTITITLRTVATVGSETSWGTIEKALEKANSGDTVWVVPDETGNVIIKKDITIPSGVTLVLPYGKFTGTDDATVRNKEVDGGDYGKATLKDVSSIGTPVSIITLSAKMEIEHGGILEISGITSGGGAGYNYSGQTGGNYAVLQMTENSSITCSGTIYAFGFIKDSGSYSENIKITVQGTGIVYQPFVVLDFRGGTYTASSKNSETSARVTAFEEYMVMNVQPKMKMVYGSQMMGWANLHTWNPDQNNFTTVSLVGTTSKHLLQMTTTDSYFVSKVEWDETNNKPKTFNLNMYGGAKLNSMSLTVDIPVLGAQEADTTQVFTTICWVYNISLNSGNYTTDLRLQLNGGARLVVEKDATLTVNNEMRVLTGDIASSYSVSNKYGKLNSTKAYTDAEFIVRGTFIVNTIGGNIRSDTLGAKVTIKSGITSTLNKVIGATGEGDDANYLDKAQSKFNLGDPIVIVAQLCNGNGTTTDSITGITYYYGNGVWFAASTTVSFDNDGYTKSNITAPIASDYSGYTVGTISDPTRTGYIFLGWYLDANRTIMAEIKNGILTNATSASTTLYAKWDALGGVAISFEYKNSLTDADTTWYDSLTSTISQDELNSVTALPDTTDFYKFNYDRTYSMYFVSYTLTRSDGTTFDSWSALISDAKNASANTTYTITANWYKKNYIYYSVSAFTATVANPYGQLEIGETTYTINGTTTTVNSAETIKKTDNTTVTGSIYLCPNQSISIKWKAQGTLGQGHMSASITNDGATISNLTNNTDIGTIGKSSSGTIKDETSNITGKQIASIVIKKA